MHTIEEMTFRRRFSINPYKRLRLPLGEMSCFKDWLTVWAWFGCAIHAQRFTGSYHIKRLGKMVKTMHLIGTREKKRGELWSYQRIIGTAEGYGIPSTPFSP